MDGLCGQSSYQGLGCEIMLPEIFPRSVDQKKGDLSNKDPEADSPEYLVPPCPLVRALIRRREESYAGSFTTYYSDFTTFSLRSQLFAQAKAIPSPVAGCVVNCGLDT